MRRGVRPLDLIPPAIKPRRLSRAEALTTGALAATILITLVALLLPGFMESRRLSRLNREIARIDTEVRAAERVVRDLDRKRHILATVEKINSTAIRPLPVLRELTDIIPADAWLTYVAFDGKGVASSGFLSTKEQYAYYQLNGTPLPVAMTKYSLTFTKAGDFKYVCALHDGAGMFAEIHVR